MDTLKTDLDTLDVFEPFWTLWTVLDSFGLSLDYNELETQGSERKATSSVSPLHHVPPPLARGLSSVLASLERQPVTEDHERCLCSTTDDLSVSIIVRNWCTAPGNTTLSMLFSIDSPPPLVIDHKHMAV